MRKLQHFLKMLYGIIRICRNWPTVFLNHLLVKSHLVADKINSFEHILLRDGTKFSAPLGVSSLSDIRVILEVWYWGVYSIRKDSDINEGDIVVDIGANKGFFSIFASKRGAKVFAFEPVPRNFLVIKENIKLNNVTDNVIAEQIAISNKDGVAQINLSSINDGAHSMVNDVHSQDSIEVKTAPFSIIWDKYSLDKIDFLKVDCEGAEYQIFGGMSREDLSKINKVSIEYHEVAGHSPEELVALLEGNNFKILESSGGYIKAEK